MKSPPSPVGPLPLSSVDEKSEDLDRGSDTYTEQTSPMSLEFLVTVYFGCDMKLLANTDAAVIGKPDNLFNHCFMDG